MSKLNALANLTKSFPSRFRPRVCNHSDSSTNKSQRVKRQRTNETRCLWKTCGAKNYALLGSCATPCDATVNASEQLTKYLCGSRCSFWLSKGFLSSSFFFLLLQHSLVNNLLQKLSGGFFALGGGGMPKSRILLVYSLQCYEINCKPIWGNDSCFGPVPT